MQRGQAKPTKKRAAPKDYQRVEELDVMELTSEPAMRGARHWNDSRMWFDGGQSDMLMHLMLPSRIYHDLVVEAKAQNVSLNEAIVRVLRADYEVRLKAHNLGVEQDQLAQAEQARVALRGID